MFRIGAYYIQHCSGNGTRSTRVIHVPTNSLLSIMSSSEPRKSKRATVKKLYHRLFPRSSSSSQKSESTAHAPSTTVTPSHTLHASEGGFLDAVQDMGKYIDRNADCSRNLLRLDIQSSTSADPDQEKIVSDKQPQVKEAGRFSMISLWRMLTYRYSKETPPRKCRFPQL